MIKKKHSLREFLHVMNCTLAITTKSQAIGHISSSVFSKIERMLPLMRMFWISIRYHHFRKRQSIEYGAFGSLVIISDVVEHNALLVVESDMNLPVLPVYHPTFYSKRNSVWLRDVDWLDVLSIAPFILNCCWMVVVWFCLVDWSAHIWDINVDDFLLPSIEDRAEIERERVLRIIHMWSVVH